MGAILIAVTGIDPKAWQERFRTLAPQRDVRVWPQRVGNPADVTYACAWHPPAGLLAERPLLEGGGPSTRSSRSAPASII